MKEIQIRQAVIEDLEQVAAVEARCFPAAEAADEKSLKERLEAFPGSFLVAECEGRIAGFINPRGAYQSIFGLDVDEDFRHQGLAGRLMKALIEKAESEGRKGLILTCKEHLIGFYEQFGYCSMGVSKSVHGGAVWYDMILEFSR